MTWLYWCLCFLIGVLPAFFVYRKDRRRNTRLNWLPALLRFLVFFWVAVLLLAPAFPSHKMREEKPVLLWLQDNSLSVKFALGKDSLRYRKQTETLLKKWEQKYKVITLAFGSNIQKDSTFHFTQSSTNMAAALQYASDQYQDRNLGAIILSGDGVFNEGANPLFTKLSLQAPVYTIGLGDSTLPQDAVISRAYANKTVPLHNHFELIVDIQAFKLDGKQSTVTVTHQGNTIASRPVSIQGNSFTNTLHFEIMPTQKGFQRYTVACRPVGAEKNLSNNRMDVFIEVIDRETSVLLLAAAPHPDVAAIKAALAATEYKVTVKYGKDIPADIQDYSLLIAHQVPALQSGRFSIPDKMPVWYILGQQSDLNTFNQSQSLLRIENGGAANDVLPRLNTGFNYFSLPEAIREVIPKLPPLKVPSGQYQKVRPSVSIFTQQIGNTDTDYPLWIVQSGDQPIAVLCGTGIWRWRVYEYKYFRKQETIDDLIRKTVTLLHIQKDEQPFRVFLDKNLFSDTEPIRVFAALRNENQEQINTPEAHLIIQDTAGHKLNYLFEKTGSSYQVNAGILAAGDYTFSGNVAFNGKRYSSQGAFRVNSVPLERLRSNSDFSLLYQLAGQHNGKFYTLEHMNELEREIEANEQIKPVLHNEITYRSWIDRKWVFFLILLFAVAEWLLRKYWNL